MTVIGPIVCFGEMLLRLSPTNPGDDLASTRSLAVHVAGAEANVAISLASLGQPSRMVTILPEGELGGRAQAALETHGVETGGIVRREGRMGLFFLNSHVTGREGGIIYDRAQSAFAAASAEVVDLNAQLAGAAMLHVSGITAALGDTPLAILHSAMAAARAAQVPISFDCNYRPALWRGREHQAASILRKLAGQADWLFASPWDLAQLTGSELAGDSFAKQFEAGSKAAFEQFPQIQSIATTSRTVIAQDHHELSAHLARRDTITHAPARTIHPVIERIGSGDSFAAAILYGALQGYDDEYLAKFALQACVMKHAIPGDFSTLNVKQIEAALG